MNNYMRSFYGLGLRMAHIHIELARTWSEPQVKAGKCSLVVCSGARKKMWGSK